MKPIRTLPRFKCDFCNRRGVRSTIARHEGRCFKNPKRFCDACQNTGIVMKLGCKCKTLDELMQCECPMVEMPCDYCARYREYLQRNSEIGPDSRY